MGHSPARTWLSTLVAPAAVGLLVLFLLQMAHASVIHKPSSGDLVFMNEQAAVSFLSRSLLYNSWDFELVVPDNLDRECYQEVCDYEEARECFEDDAKTAQFWKTYTSSHGYTPPVDIGGLVAGLLAIVVIAIIAVVLGIYCHYKKKNKTRRPAQVPVRMAGDGRPNPEVVALTGLPHPVPPAYNDAVNHDGPHDIQPPPYSPTTAPSAPTDSDDP